MSLAMKAARSIVGTMAEVTPLYCIGCLKDKTYIGREFESCLTNLSIK
jgi:hypothetical protein